MATLSASNLFGDYVQQGTFDEYTWIFVFSIVFAFLAAYGIGANDVANAFGTSVGSGALSMRQALFIASIFEFTGAFFLGAQVTNTISGGIAKGSAFMREPELLMFGMACVDLGVAFWLLLATYLELPVSTTHSVVGGVIGMTLVIKGRDAVIWNESIDEFPYIKGVSVIVISWITSPLLSALGAGFLFFLVRLTVLRSSAPFDRSFLLLPLIVAITAAINIMFLIQKAGKNYGSEDIPQGEVQLYAWCSGVGAGLITLLLMPLLKKKILRDKEDKIEAAKSKSESVEKGGEADIVEAPKMSMFQSFLKNTLDRDVKEEGLKTEKVADIHANGEVFDADTEEVFKYLQVFTACCDSLAHGSNDVANAIGPLAAVSQIYHKGSFSSKSPVEKWVLGVGSVGLVIGLATYGYNIIRALGIKLSLVTASRGFAIELGSAMTVLVASNYGLPVSTTHCQVGATVGVGALEGGAGVNWVLFIRMFAGWVMTLVMAGGITALFVAFGAYSPSHPMALEIQRYEDGLRMRSNALNYGLMWQAEAQGNPDGSTFTPASFNSSAESFTYTLPEVADRSSKGVYNNKAYQSWRAELWDDAGVFTKTTSWTNIWDQALGYNNPDWKGANSSTISSEQVFMMFDKVVDFAFAPNVQAEIKEVLAGTKFLCCDEKYKCCPRKCKWKKVNEDCKGKCEGKKSDPECMEEPCDEQTSSSAGAAKTCVIVESSDDCPVKMDETNKKNYLVEAYVSNPITSNPITPETPYSAKYGGDFTDYREPWEEYSKYSAGACPIKF